MAELPIPDPRSTPSGGEPPVGRPLAPTAPAADAATAATAARIARGTDVPPVARQPAAEPLADALAEVGRASDERDGMWEREPLGARWARRAITIPGLFVITLTYLALLPAILLYAALSDAVHRRPLLLCRFHLTFFAILAWHCVGVITLAIWWPLGKALALDRSGWRHFHRALEAWWAHHVLGLACTFYRARYVVEGAELVAPGPVLILSRHASTLDTILPLRVLGRRPPGLILRIVKKRELLWDPCVDLISQRLPRTFVRRGSPAIGAELARLVRLCDGMAADDAVVIFPEGTRFTAAKRADVLAKLAVRNPEAAVRAARLQHVLPPRPIGTLALLEARPDMDVVFCAHTGLEEANRLDDLVGGSLLDRDIKVKFWRVPRADVPAGRDARIAWLHEWWERVDRWVDAHRDPPGGRRPRLGP